MTAVYCINPTEYSLHLLSYSKKFKLSRYESTSNKSPHSSYVITHINYICFGNDIYGIIITGV